SNGSSIGDEAKWKIADNFIFMYLPIEYNIASSWIGYLVFAFVLHACRKKYVFWKRAYDVFLILFYALLVDIVKMRMYAYFALMKHHGHRRDFWIVPTSLAACTIGFWSFLFYFYTTY
ncbi:hypothetical protein PMAYCL1PPCAC_22261, partial [Pristionchus mayeri]